MIEVANLSKRYGDLTAVQDVSFTAAPGEILGFLGPNGAGKTTTLRVITGFLPATSGTVRVCGFDVFEQSAEVRRRIGYLPENPPLYNDMMVVPYLRFAARIHGVERGGVGAAVDRVIDTCGLCGVTGRLLGHLSKGFRQRVEGAVDVPAAVDEVQARSAAVRHQYRGRRRRNLDFGGRGDR